MILRLLLITVILMAGSSCKELSTQHEVPSEGVIEYTVSYSDEMQQLSLSSFFPKKVTTTYNKEQFKVKIHGILGMYEMLLINPLSQNPNSAALLKVFDQKLTCPMPLETIEQMQGFDQSAEFALYPDSVKTIAGIESQLMRVKLAQHPELDIQLYYSKGSGLKLFADQTTFLPGVLTGMILKHQHHRVMLMANKITAQSTPDHEFEIPSEYRSISTSEMTDIFKALLN